MPIRRFKRHTAGRVILTLFVLVTAWVAQAPTYAQDSFEFSEDLFYELLDERGDSLDAARAGVADEFDELEAAEIAAYLCAPDPDPACKGSGVLAAWDVFLDGLYDDRSVDEILGDMSQSDEYLAIAIVVHWCTPPAGYGCEEEEYDERQSDFVDEDQVKEQPASRDSGAQFFGGKKRRSRTRGRRG